MTGLFLCLAMVAGVSEAGEREYVLSLCVEKTIPRKEWEAQVQAEAKRQGKGKEAVAYFSGPYYDAEVCGWLRWQFISSSYSWEFDEQVWLLLAVGKAPDPSRPLTLGWRVTELGQKLPRDMRKR